jgi:hypothetical protein
MTEKVDPLASSSGATATLLVLIQLIKATRNVRGFDHMSFGSALRETGRQLRESGDTKAADVVDLVIKYSEK